MGETFEAGELRRLEHDFFEAAQLAPSETMKALKVSAFNIKIGAQRRVGGLRHAPAYPRSITYDVRQGAAGPEAEIGPDKNRRQGALGNLLEFGSVKNSPHPHMRPSGEHEMPHFERAMEDLSVRLLEEGR